ncbi:MAG: AAA family ATPase [Lachnospiraceae bacterium]|nr:AAA family ATPase [Lachnospiraceae bacterium]
MGIFSKKSSDSDSARADNISFMLVNHVTNGSKKLWQNLKDYERDHEKCPIKPFSLYLSVIEAIFRNNVDFNEKNWYNAVLYGQEIYPSVFVMEEQTPGFQELSLVFLEMFDEGGIVSKQMFMPRLYLMFQDKMNYVRWAKSLTKPKYASLEKDAITEYALKARPYCPDEMIFTTSLIRFTDRVAAGEKPEKLIEQEMSVLNRMAGIYNVSEERIMLAEQKIDAVQAASMRLQDSLELSEKRAKLLSELSENTTKSVQSYCDSELTRAKVKVDDMMQQMERNHTAFVESQRREIIADKNEIVSSVIADSQREITDLRRIVNDMVRNARDEIMKATRETGNVISRMDEYFQDNERIKELLANAETSRQLNERIDKLMVLSERELTPPPPPPAPAPAQKVVVVNRPQPGKVPPEGGEQVPDVFAETGDMALSEPENDVLDFASVKLLDESIPFATRFAEAMKRKQMMMNKGVHFHKMFDDVITAVIENANPYMIGPSGCGKTFMVQQIAAILELESIDIGYINEEYDILGFQTANGGYSRPNFYRCYKYGKIAFCDELDNGNSRATVKLNSFLSNNKNAHYNFPNGERVARHPNFRIIAAGNTTGSGADINYNTREKIEESVQQRFTPIFVGYDNEVEKSILGNYHDWYEFVVAFRHATDAWSKHTHFSAAGIITTRDVTRIRKYLDNRSFTPAKILEYEFVQTKDPEYLAFLAKELGAEVKKNTYSDACRKIYAMFASRVTEIRSGSDTSRLM